MTAPMTEESVMARVDSVEPSVAEVGELSAMLARALGELRPFELMVSELV